ncbi:MAG: phosphoribosylamine--glycine ligase [Propionibacteriaceae bacterium]|nr:phosphoribosylamine--glycine ligase [Propionibacteriaceae bacterium]
MKVLVVGSGGREHALALAIARDDVVEAVHVAPGNPGTWAMDTKYGLDHHTELGEKIRRLDPVDATAVVELAQTLATDLVVIGPEAPLVAGVADEVRAAGITCFGPSKEAAQLEGSKQYAKEVMTAAGVPTARSAYCTTQDQIEAALDEFGAPYVVKNDGLAAGKGVVVTDDRDEALAHGLACGQVVIEEYLDGPEVSLFAICDGTTAVPLIPAQDFKRVGEGDTGPNTGGMGAYCPLPWVPEGLTDAVMEQVVGPTLAEMANRGTLFQGLLYVGLALTSNGLKVVEFNVRFGDPETEAILPLLTTPLGQTLHAAATGSLGDSKLTWKDGSSIVVVYAAKGYPGTPDNTGTITIGDTPKSVQVIHCGTTFGANHTLIPKGGRILAITAQGDNLNHARERVYSYIETIDYPTGFFRPDIAAAAAQGLIEEPTI